MDPIDFIAGSASGALSQLFGHPFDTVKVRMQTSSGVYNRGLIDAFRRIIVHEGPLALFQGVPAVSTLAHNCTVGIDVKINDIGHFLEKSVVKY